MSHGTLRAYRLTLQGLVGERHGPGYNVRLHDFVGFAARPFRVHADVAALPPSHISRPGGHPASIRDEARQFWLPVDILERTLALAPRLEASSGIEIRFTLDDGNVSDHDLALPLLLAHRRTASFFVCAGRIGQPGHLSPAQLRALVHSGMVVGCHGHDHVNWREVDDRRLIHELRDARRQRRPAR